MKTNKAFEIAMANDVFKKHHENVMRAMENGEQSSCMIFAVDGECFYYGFDGVELHKGKHTANRSKWLLNKDMAYVIR